MPDVADDASPCRQTCDFDASTSLCRDCGRLANEIAEWPEAGRARRLAIRAAATARLTAARARASTS